MTDYRAAARKAREQVNLDLGKLRNLGFDDIDVTVGRRRQSRISGGFSGGFVLGVLAGALVALLVALRKGHDTRHLLSEAGSRLRGRAMHLVQRTGAAENGSRIRIAGDFVEGPAIEREIGDAAESSGDSVTTPARSFGGRPGI